MSYGARHNSLEISLSKHIINPELENNITQLCSTDESVDLFM